MKILAIDTASDACSAALWLDGEVSERYEVTPRRHTSMILPMVESLLLEADIALHGLDCIAFGRGPGAFTGVRIASGVAQGLALGADLPVVAVSSLAALAQGVWRVHRQASVLAAFDARMGEIYWGAYSLDDNDFVKLVGDEVVCAPQLLPVPLEAGLAWFAAGGGWRICNGAAVCESVNITGMDAECLPHARDVALLATSYFKKGMAVSAEHALPVYLRDNVVRM